MQESRIDGTWATWAKSCIAATQLQTRPMTRAFVPPTVPARPPTSGPPPTSRDAADATRVGEPSGVRE